MPPRPNFKTCITHETVRTMFWVRLCSHSKSNHGSVSDRSKKCQQATAIVSRAPEYNILLTISELYFVSSCLGATCFTEKCLWIIHYVSSSSPLKKIRHYRQYSIPQMSPIHPFFLPVEVMSLEAQEGRSHSLVSEQLWRPGASDAVSRSGPVITLLGFLLPRPWCYDPGPSSGVSTLSSTPSQLPVTCLCTLQTFSFFG